MSTAQDVHVPLRLTQFAAGGGCSCKISAPSLEALLASVYANAPFEPNLDAVVCGLDWGDDAAVVRAPDGGLVVSTTDFFPPVVDDPFAWGQIAAANALSDIYAMGATPLCALNLFAWPTARLSMELAAEVLRGGASICAQAQCPLVGGHSIDDDSPKYGLAVTGTTTESQLLSIDQARPGDPISLTKPLGVGILNNLHKVTGASIDAAIAQMVTLNRSASQAAVAARLRAATDVTGFGLLGHLYKMTRASGVSAMIDAAAVPVLDGVREAAAAGFIPGGTRRNLEWVRRKLDTALDELDLLLLADAQTSGGLLVAGTLPDAPVIGRFVSREDWAIRVH